MSASEPLMEQNVPLAPRTWYKLGGTVDLFARPRTPEDAMQFVRRAHDEGLPVRVLGGGSNVLIADEGIRGTVMSLSAPPFTSLRRVSDEAIQCGAGVRLARLVNAMADWGLSGAEGLTGIPGTIGGALRSNAGTERGEIGPIVRTVWALDGDGKQVEIGGGECDFSYRSSGLGGMVILGAELLVRREDPDVVRSRMQELAEHRRDTQPRGIRSAGCIFRNPPGNRAGRLIDELGLKGFAIGDARVSTTHANFIEAGPGTSARDVKSIIDHVRERVFDAHGLRLELQIELWGFDE